MKNNGHEVEFLNTKTTSEHRLCRTNNSLTLESIFLTFTEF